MNERIKQLEKQCWRSTQSDPYALFDVKKFAELIVRECAGVAIDNGCGDFVDIKQKLFEHFGVDE